MPAMQKTISVSIPHDLGRDEAKARLQRSIAQARVQYAQHIGRLDEHWSGDRLDFKLTMMGQSLTGRINVEAECVKVDVDVPWLLAMLADKIKGQIEQRGRMVLEDKRGKEKK